MGLRLLGFGEKGLSRVSLSELETAVVWGSRGSPGCPLISVCIHPYLAQDLQHGALRLQSSRARPSPIPPLLSAFRERAHSLFPALTSSLVRKRRGRGDKDACATVTFPPEKGGNSLCSVRVRAEALRV